MRLSENPFHVLGASPQDSRRRIMELAEERSLTVAPEACARAKADLTNPRNRLAAEVAWLPGTAKERCTQVTTACGVTRPALASLTDLSPLARANALASILAEAIEQAPRDLAADWLLELAEACEQTHATDVQATINADRAAAGIPPVQDPKDLEDALADRRRYYVASARAYLDRMPSRELVAAVTLAVDKATRKGTRQAPLVIDQFVQVFEIEAKRFMEIEARNVSKVLASIQEAAARGVERPAMERHVNRLRVVLKNWDLVAQPIQMAAMGRGSDHDESVRLAREVRETAIKLHNDHALLWAAKWISALLREVFAEVPRIVEIVDNDIATLVRMSGPSNDALLAELLRQGKLR